MSIRASRLATIVPLAATLMPFVASNATAAETERVSVSSNGAQAAGGFASAVSLDGKGRYVAFESSATNLVPDDTNDKFDVFVHDRKTGKTTRVSVSSTGEQALGDSTAPSISANGRYIAFTSVAANLVADDTNADEDVFVHDRVTGETTRVSVHSNGAQGTGGGSREPAISSSGRYIAFESDATNLVDDDTTFLRDVFVHDRKSGKTQRVSVDSAGVQAFGGHSEVPSISANGRFVAFASGASNLVSDDTNFFKDVFVHDRKKGKTERISVATDGAQMTDAESRDAVISSDGRIVAFASASANLVPLDTNMMFDIFTHDRKSGKTERVSVDANGAQLNFPSFDASLSKKGREVAFESMAPGAVPDDTNFLNDVFVHNRKTGKIHRVSLDSSGAEATGGGSSLPSISSSGRYVAFVSDAKNLVSDDDNDLRDIFVRDRK